MRLSMITAPVAIGSLLLLAGCSAGSDAPGEEPTAEASDAPTAGEDLVPEKTAESEEDEALSSPDGAACLEGTWDVDMEVLKENSIPEIEGTETSVEVTGSSSLTFDGSTLRYEYDQQNSRVTVSMPDQPSMVIGVEANGVAAGAYTATDGELVVTDVDISGLTMRSTTEVDGAEIETPGLEDAGASGVPLGGTSTYVCDGDELRITPQVDGVDTSGFEQVLHRR